MYLFILPVSLSLALCHTSVSFSSFSSTCETVIKPDVFLLLGHVVMCTLHDWVWFLYICSLSLKGVCVCISESTQILSRRLHKLALIVWCNKLHISPPSWQTMWEAVTHPSWNHNDFIHVVCMLRGSTAEYSFSVLVFHVVVSFTVGAGVFFSNRESCVSAAVWLNQPAALVVS